jgi:hypothetical protein
MSRYTKKYKSRERRLQKGVNFDFFLLEPIFIGFVSITFKGRNLFFQLNPLQHVEII